MSEIAELNLNAADTQPITAEGLAGWIAEARALLKLAAPLMITQLAQIAIMTTDIVMLGRLSSQALAAATLGNTVFFFTWLIGFGPASAISPMIAHAVGANPNDRAQTRHITRMGLWSVLILSVPLITMLLFTRQILLWLDQEPQLAVMAGQFTTAICLGLPAAIGFQVLRNFATALSRPIAPLIVMGAAIIFNAVGDYALIFGHFGLPRLGVVGSGVSSALSLTFTFLAMVAVIYWTPALRKYRIFRRFWRPVWHQLAEVFRLGLPIGMTTIFEAMMFNAATLVMGTFGAASLAAHQIAMNVPSITFMVPLGIGMAATVRVGLAAGAGDGHAVRRAGYSAIVMGVGFMAFTSAILWLVPDRIAGLYLPPTKANADVIRIAITFLHVAAVFQMVDGLQVVASLSLRGLKDARAPMWIAGGAYWLAGAPMCAWLAFGENLKGLGIWYGLAFGLLMAAIAMMTRWIILAGRR